MEARRTTTSPGGFAEERGQSLRVRIEPSYDTTTARGEKRLMVAVLRDAIAEFRRFRAASNRRGRRLFADVQAWFAANDDAWPFAFVSICETLGLDSGRLRQVLDVSESSRGR
jgi:hypothetical protein